MALIVALLCFGSASRARLVAIWDLNDIYKKADLVAIVGDARSRGSHDELNDRWGRREGMLTSVKILLVLKGEIKAERVTIFHYRAVAPGTLTNGPQLVEFEPDEPLGEKRQYLVFLTKGEGERYEPASGQFDPVYSVRKLSKAVPTSTATTQPAERASK
ncbi:MAG TPA: hypothetical protein VGI81_01840 [Tepidisphaeraceae bacterium]